MKLGVIGYGGRMRGVTTNLLDMKRGCELAYMVDPNKEEILKQDKKGLLKDTRWFDTPEELIAARPDGILIGTRCSLHTTMALKVIPSGIPLFLEKPVSTTKEDLLRLKQAHEKYQSPVVVSFPLRGSIITKTVKDIIDSGQLGTIEHVQAVNNVVRGGVYYHRWYRDESITGGLFLQKTTHDYDYINYLLGQRPVSLCAMTSKQIFKGDKPAGLKCVDCEENRTCPESTAFKEGLSVSQPYCCFAEDTGNEDSGSAIVRYESGMHVNYSQNFFVRRGAGARGAQLMGYKGTIAFDFHTQDIKVHMHHTPRVEIYKVEPEGGHHGGDVALFNNFIDVMNGKAASQTRLEDGLLSALMCMKSIDSAKTGTFQNIDWNV